MKNNKKSFFLSFVFSVKVVKDWRTRAQTEVYDKPDLVSGLLETGQELWMMLDTEERKRYGASAGWPFFRPHFTKNVRGRALVPGGRFFGLTSQKMYLFPKDGFCFN
jgi:hypothetical protein